MPRKSQIVSHNPSSVSTSALNSEGDGEIIERESGRYGLGLNHLEGQIFGDFALGGNVPERFENKYYSPDSLGSSAKNHLTGCQHLDGVSIDGSNSIKSKDNKDKHNEASCHLRNHKEGHIDKHHQLVSDKIAEMLRDIIVPRAVSWNDRQASFSKHHVYQEEKSNECAMEQADCNVLRLFPPSSTSDTSSSVALLKMKVRSQQNPEFVGMSPKLQDEMSDNSDEDDSNEEVSRKRIQDHNGTTRRKLEFFLSGTVSLSDYIVSSNISSEECDEKETMEYNTLGIQRDEYRTGISSGHLEREHINWIFSVHLPTASLHDKLASLVVCPGEEVIVAVDRAALLRILRDEVSKHRLTKKGKTTEVTNVCNHVDSSSEIVDPVSIHNGSCTVLKVRRSQVVAKEFNNSNVVREKQAQQSMIIVRVCQEVNLSSPITTSAISHYALDSLIDTTTPEVTMIMTGIIIGLATYSMSMYAARHNNYTNTMCGTNMSSQFRSLGDAILMPLYHSSLPSTGSENVHGSGFDMLHLIDVAELSPPPVARASNSGRHGMFLVSTSTARNLSTEGSDRHMDDSALHCTAALRRWMHTELLQPVVYRRKDTDICENRTVSNKCEVDNETEDDVQSTICPRRPYEYDRIPNGPGLPMLSNILSGSEGSKVMLNIYKNDLFIDSGTSRHQLSLLRVLVPSSVRMNWVRILAGGGEFHQTDSVSQLQRVDKLLFHFWVREVIPLITLVISSIGRLSGLTDCGAPLLAMEIAGARIVAVNAAYWWSAECCIEDELTHATGRFISPLIGILLKALSSYLLCSPFVTVTKNTTIASCVDKSLNGVASFFSNMYSFGQKQKKRKRTMLQRLFQSNVLTLVSSDDSAIIGEGDKSMNDNMISAEDVAAVAPEIRRLLMSDCGIPVSDDCVPFSVYFASIHREWLDLFSRLDAICNKVLRDSVCGTKKEPELIPTFLSLAPLSTILACPTLEEMYQSYYPEAASKVTELKLCCTQERSHQCAESAEHMPQVGEKHTEGVSNDINCHLTPWCTGFSSAHKSISAFTSNQFNYRHQLIGAMCSAPLFDDDDDCYGNMNDTLFSSSLGISSGAISQSDRYNSRILNEKALIGGASHGSLTLLFDWWIQRELNHQREDEVSEIDKTKLLMRIQDGRWLKDVLREFGVLDDNDDTSVTIDKEAILIHNIIQGSGLNDTYHGNITGNEYENIGRPKEDFDSNHSNNNKKSDFEIFFSLFDEVSREYAFDSKLQNKEGSILSVSQRHQVTRIAELRQRLRAAVTDAAQYVPPNAMLSLLPLSSSFMAAAFASSSGGSGAVQLYLWKAILGIRRRLFWGYDHYHRPVRPLATSEAGVISDVFGLDSPFVSCCNYHSDCDSMQPHPLSVGSCDPAVLLIRLLATIQHERYTQQMMMFEGKITRGEVSGINNNCFTVEWIAQSLLLMPSQKQNSTTGMSKFFFHPGRFSPFSITSIFSLSLESSLPTASCSSPLSYLRPLPQSHHTPLYIQCCAAFGEPLCVLLSYRPPSLYAESSTNIRSFIAPIVVPQPHIPIDGDEDVYRDNTFPENDTRKRESRTMRRLAASLHNGKLWTFWVVCHLYQFAGMDHNSNMIAWIHPLHDADLLVTLTSLATEPLVMIAPTTGGESGGQEIEEQDIDLEEKKVWQLFGILNHQRLMRCLHFTQDMKLHVRVKGVLHCDNIDDALPGRESVIPFDQVLLTHLSPVIGAMKSMNNRSIFNTTISLTDAVYAVPPQPSSVSLVPSDYQAFLHRNSSPIEAACDRVETVFPYLTHEQRRILYTMWASPVRLSTIQALRSSDPPCASFLPRTRIIEGFCGSGKTSLIAAASIALTHSLTTYVDGPVCHSGQDVDVPNSSLKGNFKECPTASSFDHSSSALRALLQAKDDLIIFGLSACAGGRIEGEYIKKKHTVDDMKWWSYRTGLLLDRFAVVCDKQNTLASVLQLIGEKQPDQAEIQYNNEELGELKTTNTIYETAARTLPVVCVEGGFALRTALRRIQELHQHDSTITGADNTHRRDYMLTVPQLLQLAYYRAAKAPLVMSTSYSNNNHCDTSPTSMNNKEEIEINKLLQVYAALQAPVVRHDSVINGGNNMNNIIDLNPQQHKSTLQLADIVLSLVLPYHFIKELYDEREEIVNNRRTTTDGGIASKEIDDMPFVSLFETFATFLGCASTFTSANGVADTDIHIHKRVEELELYVLFGQLVNIWEKGGVFPDNALHHITSAITYISRISAQMSDGSPELVNDRSQYMEQRKCYSSMRSRGVPISESLEGRIVTPCLNSFLALSSADTPDNKNIRHANANIIRRERSIYSLGHEDIEVITQEIKEGLKYIIVKEISMCLGLTAGVEIHLQEINNIRIFSKTQDFIIREKLPSSSYQLGPGSFRSIIMCDLIQCVAKNELYRRGSQIGDMGHILGDIQVGKEDTGKQSRLVAKPRAKVLSLRCPQDAHVFGPLICQLTAISPSTYPFSDSCYSSLVSNDIKNDKNHYTTSFAEALLHSDISSPFLPPPAAIIFDDVDTFHYSAILHLPLPDIITLSSMSSGAAGGMPIVGCSTVTTSEKNSTKCAQERGEEVYECDIDGLSEECRTLFMLGDGYNRDEGSCSRLQREQQLRTALGMCTLLTSFTEQLTAVYRHAPSGIRLGAHDSNGEITIALPARGLHLVYFEMMMIDIGEEGVIDISSFLSPPSTRAAIAAAAALCHNISRSLLRPLMVMSILCKGSPFPFVNSNTKMLERCIDCSMGDPIRIPVARNKNERRLITRREMQIESSSFSLSLPPRHSSNSLQQYIRHPDMVTLVKALVKYDQNMTLNSNDTHNNYHNRDILTSQQSPQIHQSISPYTSTLNDNVADVRVGNARSQIMYAKEGQDLQKPHNGTVTLSESHTLLKDKAQRKKEMLLKVFRKEGTSNDSDAITSIKYQQTTESGKGSSTHGDNGHFSHHLHNYINYPFAAKRWIIQYILAYLPSYSSYHRENKVTTSYSSPPADPNMRRAILELLDNYTSQNSVSSIRIHHFVAATISSLKVLIRLPPVSRHYYAALSKMADRSAEGRRRFNKCSSSADGFIKGDENNIHTIVPVLAAKQACRIRQDLEEDPALVTNCLDAKVLLWNPNCYVPYISGSGDNVRAETGALYSSSDCSPRTYVSYKAALQALFPISSPNPTGVVGSSSATLSPAEYAALIPLLKSAVSFRKRQHLLDRVKLKNDSSNNSHTKENSVSVINQFPTREISAVQVDDISIRRPIGTSISINVTIVEERRKTSNNEDDYHVGRKMSDAIVKPRLRAFVTIIPRPFPSDWVGRTSLTSVVVLDDDYSHNYNTAPSIVSNRVTGDGKDDDQHDYKPHVTVNVIPSTIQRHRPHALHQQPYYGQLSTTLPHSYCGMSSSVSAAADSANKYLQRLRLWLLRCATCTLQGMVIISSVATHPNANPVMLASLLGLPVTVMANFSSLSSETPRRAVTSQDPWAIITEKKEQPPIVGTRCNEYNGEKKRGEKKGNKDEQGVEAHELLHKSDLYSYAHSPNDDLTAFFSVFGRGDTHNNINDSSLISSCALMSTKVESHTSIVNRISTPINIASKITIQNLCYVAPAVIHTNITTNSHASSSRHQNGVPGKEPHSNNYGSGFYHDMSRVCEILLFSCNVVNGPHTRDTTVLPFVTMSTNSKSSFIITGVKSALPLSSRVLLHGMAKDGKVEGTYHDYENNVTLGHLQKSSISRASIAAFEVEAAVTTMYEGGQMNSPYSNFSPPFSCDSVWIHLNMFPYLSICCPRHNLGSKFSLIMTPMENNVNINSLTAGNNESTYFQQCRHHVKQVGGDGRCPFMCLQHFNHCGQAAHMCLEVCHSSDDDECDTITHNQDVNHISLTQVIKQHNRENIQNQRDELAAVSSEKNYNNDIFHGNRMHTQCPFPCSKKLTCGHLCTRPCGVDCTAYAGDKSSSARNASALTTRKMGRERESLEVPTAVSNISACGQWAVVRRACAGEYVIDGYGGEDTPRPTYAHFPHFMKKRCSGNGGVEDDICLEYVTVRCRKCGGEIRDTVRCAEVTSSLIAAAGGGDVNWSNGYSQVMEGEAPNTYDLEDCPKCKAIEQAVRRKYAGGSVSLDSPVNFEEKLKHAFAMELKMAALRNKSKALQMSAVRNEHQRIADDVTNTTPTSFLPLSGIMNDEYKAAVLKKKEWDALAETLVEESCAEQRQIKKFWVGKLNEALIAQKKVNDTLERRNQVLAATMQVECELTRKRLSELYDYVISYLAHFVA